MTDSVEPRTHTSNPAVIQQSLGGVGRNVATALQYLGVSAKLYSKVGNDIAGVTAIDMLHREGLLTSGIVRCDGEARTAQYVAVNDARKDLFIAMADMSILQSPAYGHRQNNSLGDWRGELASTKPRWLVVDANWDPYTLAQWLDEARKIGVKVAFEPVSAAKAKGLFAGRTNGGASTSICTVPNETVSLATPNAMELASMYDSARDAGIFDGEDCFRIIDSIGLSSSGSRYKLVSLTNSALVDRGVPQQSIQLLPFIPSIATTLGDQGVLLTQLLPPSDERLTSPAAAPYILSCSMDGNDVFGGVYMRLFPPVKKGLEEDIVSVNGVGDTFLGALIAGLTRSPANRVEDLIDIAQEASVLTLKSKEAVSPEISSLRAALTKKLAEANG